MLVYSAWTFSVLCVLLSCYRAYSKLKQGPSHEKKIAPRARWTIPYWDHIMVFVRGAETMATAFIPHIGTKIPVRFQMPGQSLYLVSGPTDVRKMLFDVHHFEATGQRARFIGNVLNVSKPCLEMISKDNSGTGPVALPGSNVPAHKRIQRAQQVTTFDPLSSNGFITMLPVYADHLEGAVAKFEIDENWQEHPHLFKWCLHLAFVAAMNTLCGEDLIRLNPGFEEQFWIFDQSMHPLYLGMPQWMYPKAYKARETCLTAIAKWKKVVRSRETREDNKGSFIDPAWGCSIMRSRQAMYDAAPEFDDRDRDCADLGFLWVANDNLAPCISWMVIELLRQPEAHKRFVVEAAKAQMPSQPGQILSRFDLKELMRNPYLQSVLHEVFRTKITSMAARDVSKDTQIGGFDISKGSVAMVNTYVEHHNKDRWESRPNARPVEQFWPERFIEYGANGEEIFSLKGLDAAFIPFGIGRAICPGRHFASRAILTVVAALLTKYEFEPIGELGWAQPKQNWQAFGWTVFQPSREFPFRVREKVVS